MHAPRSRFLPAPLLGLFEQRVLGSGDAAAGEGTARTGLPKVDLGAQLLDMWR